MLKKNIEREDRRDECVFSGNDLQQQQKKTDVERNHS